MISFVEGELADIGSDHVVIAAGGIGYVIQAGSRDISSMPHIGSNIRMYTYMSVRDDAISLFGFFSSEELELFKKLLAVSGVGPKAALSMLGFMGAQDLVTAIVADDVKAISACPGVGAKTAGRIILDLRDKVDPTKYIPQEDGSIDVHEGGRASNVLEVTQALVSLGYGRSEAHRAVCSVQGAGDMSAEELLKIALRQIV